MIRVSSIHWQEMELEIWVQFFHFSMCPKPRASSSFLSSASQRGMLRPQARKEEGGPESRARVKREKGGGERTKENQVLPLIPSLSFNANP